MVQSGPSGGKSSASLKPVCAALVSGTERGCSKEPVNGQPYCMFHATDPVSRALAASARRAGGKVARQVSGLPPEWKVDLSTADGALAAIEAAVEATGKGQISSAAATAISSLVRAATEIQAARTELAIKELAAQVEAALAEQERRRH